VRRRPSAGADGSLALIVEIEATATAFAAPKPPPGRVASRPAAPQALLALDRFTRGIPASSLQSHQLENQARTNGPGRNHPAPVAAGSPPSTAARRWPIAEYGSGFAPAMLAPAAVHHVRAACIHRARQQPQPRLRDGSVAANSFRGTAVVRPAVRGITRNQGWRPAKAASPPPWPVPGPSADHPTARGSGQPQAAPPASDAHNTAPSSTVTEADHCGFA